MKREVVEEHIERLRMRERLSSDYIECQIIKAQIEVLEMLLEAYL